MVSRDQIIFDTEVCEAQGLGEEQLLAWGAEEIAEAFEGDCKDLESLLGDALRQVLNLGTDKVWWGDIIALYDRAVVIRKNGSDRLWRYPYVADGRKVTLGEPTEVVREFRPVIPVAEAIGDSAFIEASGDAGRYRVRVIRAGLSGNRNLYPEAVLREAVNEGLFEGVRVFVKGDEEHRHGKGKDVRNLEGTITSVAFVEAANGKPAEVVGDLTLIDPEGPVGRKVSGAMARGMAEAFGLSIHAKVKARRKRDANGQITEAIKFTKVNSVDLIVEPGAGGAFLDVIETQTEGNPLMDRAKIIALLNSKGVLQGDGSDMSNDELETMLSEALGDATGGEGGGDGGDPPAPVAEADGGDPHGPDTMEVVRLAEARGTMRDTIRQSGLPQAAQDRLIAEFEGLDVFEAQDVEDRVQGERDYLGRVAGGGAVQGLGTTRVVVVESQFEKYEDMLEAFWDPEHEDHRHAGSFRDIYITLTGDRNVTGQTRDCDRTVMAEALGGNDLSLVLGDSIHRRMLDLYRRSTAYTAWRPLVNVGRANDFRPHYLTRWGGFGDLPEVKAGHPYEDLGKPMDEEASYKVSKRGGTQSIEIEMIKNDSVSAIRRIPVHLNNSATRTLSRFVFNFLLLNGNIYDGKAFFHVDHGNLGTDALSDTAYSAGRVLMLRQEEFGGQAGDGLYIAPKFLLVPAELEEAAFNMFRRDTNLDETHTQSLKPTIVPIWCQTDPNDWTMWADPNEIPGIEIGFLDGEEEPQLLVQDIPNVGSMFSHDKMTYRIRHIYGGAVTDFRCGRRYIVPA